MENTELDRHSRVHLRNNIDEALGQVIKVPDFLPRIDLGEATTHRGRQFGTVCPGQQDLSQDLDCGSAVDRSVLQIVGPEFRRTYFLIVPYLQSIPCPETS